ncbi:hypothetical protein BH23ACT2_BH23ACT2_28470 [soil metagenome]
MSLLAVSPLLADLHDAWSWVVVVGNGLAGAWALGAHRVEALRHRTLWWFTAGAQTSIFVQVALGVTLIDGRPIEEMQFHMFYGFIAAFTVAIIFSYRAQLQAQRYLLYGFGGLFLMGLGIRNMVIPAV